MEFEIKRIITNEYFNGKVQFDLNDLEQFISERLSKLHFGESVLKYFWGFELFRFEGNFAQFFSNDIQSWKHSKKWLVTNSHFDWDKIKDLDNKEFFEVIKIELIKSLERIKEMKRKPLNFNQKEFRDRLENILNDYKITKIGVK
jgi:hypothetical protein